MVIDLFFECSVSLQQLKQILNVKYAQSSREVIWCNGFYIKLIKKRLEINVFDDKISEQYMLDNILRPIFELDENTLIRIQKGAYVSQFMANDKLVCL